MKHDPLIFMNAFQKSPASTPATGNLRRPAATQVIVRAIGGRQQVEKLWLGCNAAALSCLARA